MRFWDWLDYKLSGVLRWSHERNSHIWCEMEDPSGALIALVCRCGEYKPQVMVEARAKARSIA